MHTKMPKLTNREQAYCDSIREKLQATIEYLQKAELANPIDSAQWYELLSNLRRIQGNTSNDLSFVASLLAKQYLAKHHSASFCAAEKPQGAPGLDIDVSAEDGSRVVAEIKTTVPYQATDFGAQQAAMFRKDFEKLRLADADHKYLFVTDAGSFRALQKPKYLKLMNGVRVVLLTTGEQYDA